MSRPFFSDLMRRLREENHHYVDSRLWQDDWSDVWIAFSDVIGFASRSLRSEHVVVNAIVRFHRSVSLALAACGSSKPRLFQFTDAAFAVGRNLGEVLRFAASLQHQCFAQNAIVIDDKDHPLAHHMLLVRTTIAQGRALMLETPGPPELRTLGVDGQTLLAGDAVVKAYQIERHTVGGLISLPLDQREESRVALPTIRGRTERSRSLLEAWADGADAFVHDGVIDFPWPLVRPEQGQDGEIWADSNAEARRKLSVMLEVADLLGGEFLMAAVPLEVAKHRAGLLRHVNETAQRLEGRTKLRHWTEQALRDGLNRGR